MSGSRWKLLGLFFGTVIVVSAASVFARRSASIVPVTAERISIRVTPIHVEPIRSDSESSFNLRVVEVFQRLLPVDDLTRTGSLHALRLWGRRPILQADWSGERVLAALRNEAVAPHWKGAILTRFGAYMPFSQDEAVRRASGAERIEPHRNKTLSVFALCDVTTTSTLTIGREQHFVRELVLGAMNEVRIQHGSELPWTAIALAAYLGTDQVWENRFGEIISIERLALALTDLLPGDGPCLGTHNPYAMAFVLRVDEQTRVLSQSGRNQIKASLFRIMDILRLNQRANGAWGKDWTIESARTHGALDTPTELLATGHHLEWLALLPQDIAVPTDMVRRAGEFLVSEIQNAENENMRNNYTAYAHAGCALRDLFPKEWQAASREIAIRPRANAR